MATADTIKQYYVNILQRDPTATESSYWTATVDSGALTLNQVRDSLASGSEATTYVDQIIRIYQAAFGRKPDVTGIDGWTDQLRADATALSKIAAGFVNSTEWKNRYGDNTVNPAVLQALYQNVLGRTGSAAEIDAWMKTGQSMTQILIGFSNSAEFTEAARPSILALKQAAGDVATSALNTVYTGSGALFDPAAGTGKTYALTTTTDNLVGTNGNDVFNASTGLSADGSTAIATTNALDTIDGGAGVDTLNIENTGAKNTLTGTFKNVENLTFIGAGNVNGNAAVDVSTFSGTIKLSQTGDTAVTLNNVTGQSIALDRVADTTDVTVALGATQASASLSNVGALGDAKFSIAGAKLETVNLSTDKTAAGKTITVDDTGNTTKTANIAASGAAAVVVNSTALENVSVTGAGLVTLTAGTAPSKTLSSVGSTGGVTYAVNLVAQQFTGGAGKDTVQFGATTKAQTLGAGDDTATIAADLGTGGSIDAGDGTDTLKMTATLAASLDDNDKFNAKVSNFEKLSVTAATNETLNLANLDGLNYVVEAGNGNGLVINGMTSGGTFEFSDASTATTVNIKDAAAGTADVINVKLSAAGSFNAGTLTSADVETVNINSDDTAASPAKDGSVIHTVVLTADKATKVVVSGDAAVNLTLTGSTKVATIDASTNEAGITTNLSVTSGITLTGTAKADTVTLGQLSIVTGGAGKDAYTVTTPTSGNTYATIKDFVATETIQYTDKGNVATAALGAKLGLADTALFADYLNAAAAGDGGTNGIGKWFQFGGDTYLVLDRDAANTFQNGVDEIVKLTGVQDLSKSSFTADGLFTFTA